MCYDRGEAIEWGVCVARARTTNGRYLKGIRAREAKVLEHYVSIVSQLPFVEAVRAEPGYEGVLI